MQFLTLTQWCDYIATVHELPMKLGLERVKEVAGRLELLSPRPCVITVAGTNGKGSNVAGLEAVYLAQGYRVGAFTSPYLMRLNEEVRVQGEEIDDDTLCQAFSKIETARGEIALTVFEFNTLAALLIFQDADCDVILLEVGLGGRLDAVNIIDADAMVITSIAIDHAEWLGNTRELIAREKAGIFRRGKPVICGDFSPPEILKNLARELSAPFFSQQEDFQFTDRGVSWEWQSEKNHFENLPKPKLALQNMATVLMTVEVMQARLPVSRAALDAAFKTVNLPGRIQVESGDVTKIFDVSHNPAAATFLAENIQTHWRQGKTRAVFSMLADKDIAATLQIMKNVIDEWHIAALPVTRGATLANLQKIFAQEKIQEIKTYADIASAYESALTDSHAGDCLIVFGSFNTVSAVYAMV